MIVEQIYCHNSLRNFNYIIACDQTKEAIVIDPLKVNEILEIANNKNYKIKYIINTHEHADHTDGNKELVKHTKAKVYCHYKAINKIPCADVNSGLKKDDIITVGNINIKVLDTPGHTMAHVCLLASENNTLALFSGDTLFNAGTGHCYSCNGNPNDLYTTFDDILYKLPDDTMIYPGHDYLENNLNFTLSREPDNSYAQDLLAKVKLLDTNKFIITTMAIEKQINTFFRLDSQSVINNIKNIKDKNNTDRKTVFLELRRLRDEW